jgi:protein TonB
MSSGFDASAMIDPEQPPAEQEPVEDGEAPERTDATTAPDSMGEEDEAGTLAAPLEVFELSGNEPRVAGGMGSLYMQVNYPMAAREQGIEGRVVLTFIVDERGTPHEIEVMQSAHPMLDSAAVRAVRRTTFVPGRDDGEPVSVRMRLPIRFQLVSRNGK